MAFSFRKMFSNITYFKKSDDSSENVQSDVNLKRRRHVSDESIILNFESTEPDSTSRQCTSLKLAESVKSHAAKKGSLSDTDLLTRDVDAPLRAKRRKCKKLKLDIKKASQSMNQLSEDSFNNVENTPKHVLLECKSSDMFSERFRGFNFNKSFELIDALSDEIPSSPFDLDIDSLSDRSDSDLSDHSNKSSIKMCRKVTESQSTNEHNLVPSTSLESFADVEVDKNEDERVRLLENYQTKLGRMESFLRKLLNDFRFHIEVSKLFYSKSIVAAIPGRDIKNFQDDQMYLNECDGRSVSPVGLWNVVVEKEDMQTKVKVKRQLLSIKTNIEQFTSHYLKIDPETDKVNQKSIKFDTIKHKNLLKRQKNVSHKKRMKHFDFPDLRDAMLNLFLVEDTNATYINFSDSDDSNTPVCQCMCKCHQPSSPLSQTDSGLTTKTNDGSMSITSSIGNFSLDSSTLTAYSESLEQIVSYNSFQDTSLYNSLLQKAAIERITFYVQVHSIQLKCEESDESKSITFYCPSCKDTLNDENSLLRHILSQTHCEKIHFVYKTAYIKKCMSSGKEIQPSTVLNSMTMYRDDNKIVCFGDAMYACSLCFENLIVGESILMAHCSDPQHVDRRSKLDDIID
ncbi:unnamed protein product [Euphydryas editha]|uniref:C2H2-type domain-containing protein n=1 Tax=Euphydryas editha TaxID=104508 RepID=A0AAU9T9F7_EUPED|nr:unnamed protein product [Euphydryas editha]